MGDSDDHVEVGFGRHKNLTVEQLVLTQPDFVQWLLAKAGLEGRAATIRAKMACRSSNPILGSDFWEGEAVPWNLLPLYLSVLSICLTVSLPSRGN